MDVYLFIETEPGLAGVVMDQIVASGVATRAAVVTGPFDVFARIDDISWDDLAGRVLDGVHRIPGVRRTTSAPAVHVEQVASLVLPIPTAPFWAAAPRSESRIALVLCKIAAGTAETVAQTVARKKGVLAATFLVGDHDLLLQISGRDFDHLVKRVVDDLQSLPEITSTRTMLVLRSTPLVRRAGSGKGRKR